MKNKEIITNNKCFLRESILTNLTKKDYVDILKGKSFVTTRVNAFLERCATFY